jgi:hypothetical protein
MISLHEARRAAEALLSQAGAPFRYEFLEARMVQGEWSVVFAVFTPEGTELDGPVVIRVDPTSGRARSLYE